MCNLIEKSQNSSNLQAYESYKLYVVTSFCNCENFVNFNLHNLKYSITAMIFFF